MVRSLILLALVAGAIGLVWRTLGQPVAMPASPLAPGEKLTCISYTPFHGDQAPFERSLLPRPVAERQIAADMERLSALTSCLRTYAAAGPERMVPELARRHGLKVMQGIWLSRDLTENRREIEVALELAERYPDVIQALIVGNEVLLRGELPAEQIKDYLAEVRARSGLPVTYADVWEFWLKAPEIAAAADFLTIHILPYWEDRPVPARRAAQHVREARRHVGEAFPGKEIWIGEVGWPSAGRMRGAALPSPANQARVLSEVVAAAKNEGWEVNFIEAFDQPWKRRLEGTVGGAWGIFDNTEREPKFRFGKPVSNHPQWRLVAGLSIGVAFVVFLASWLGRLRRRQAWHRDAAVAGVALAAGLVFGWAALKLPEEGILPGDQLKGAVMLSLALVVPMAAAFAIARGDRLYGFATALDPSRWRSGLIVSVLAALLVVTVVAAMQAALGLVFDPRYRDFPLASLTAPIAALAILAFAGPDLRPCPGTAEIAAASVLAASALFIVVNEGVVNWQALWFAGLLIVLALTVLRVPAAPG